VKALAAPIAVSLGDPAGVGPEIIVAAWQALKASGPAFVVVGDAKTLLARGAPAVRRISDPMHALAAFREAVPVLDHPLPEPVTPGLPAAFSAPHIIAWIETAARLAQHGAAAAVVTAPIAKTLLYDAGFAFPGHTEFLGEICGVALPVMMLTAADLKVTLVTIHEPLARVSALLSRERIIAVGETTARALRNDFGIAGPRLAIAALNPHAGEGGALGREEIEIIAPAVAELRRLGYDATGPAPGDSLFHPEARLTYDVALCMYHDQALIPVKMLDFWGGVNVTLGLPIVRTSPDHGVAYALAGAGVARPDSLIAAVKLAAEISARRQRA
jgi:4-hydroxythreonine-4-phosphate dehydrogenase